MTGTSHWKNSLAKIAKAMEQTQQLNLRPSPLSLAVSAACEEIGHEWRASKILKDWQERRSNK